MDYKGHFATRAGRCHPLTVVDDHSRYAVGLRACGDERGGTVQAELTAIFRLLDARGDRGDLRIRVGPCIFRVWDQPLDRPALDLVGRPRPLIFRAASRAGARAPRQGKCWRFYAPADPLQAALRLAPLIIPTD